MSRNRSGFSLIEVLMAAALGCVALFIFSSFFSLTSKIDRRSEMRNRVHLATAAAMQTLKRVGRSSQRCTKVVGPPVSIECDGDWGSGVAKQRFEVLTVGDDSSLVHQELRSGVWETLREYDGVTQMEVCNDADMIAGTCTIPKPPPVTFDPASDRFFRVRLSAALADDAGADPSVRYQSAFFTRNADPVMPGLSMQPEHTEHAP